MIGDGSPISSATVPLRELIPQAGDTEALVDSIKTDIVKKMMAGGDGAPTPEKLQEEISKSISEGCTWEGTLRMKTKPKLENKNGQVS